MAADYLLELLGDTFGLVPVTVPFFPFAAALILAAPTVDVFGYYFTP